MSDKLKPCPFCGGGGSISKSYDPDGSGKFYFVQCHECRAKSPEFYAVETCPIFFGQVRDAWNTRADLSAAAKEQARAEGYAQAVKDAAGAAEKRARERVYYTVETSDFVQSRNAAPAEIAEAILALAPDPDPAEGYAIKRGEG